MPDMLSYFGRRILTGLGIVVFSLVIISLTGIGTKIRSSQPTEAEIEQARQERDQYTAEREIRSARQTGGYDPSDPALVRDGYSQTEESRYSSSGTEPYANNPSE